MIWGFRLSREWPFLYFISQNWSGPLHRWRVLLHDAQEYLFLTKSRLELALNHWEPNRSTKENIWSFHSSVMLSWKKRWTCCILSFIKPMNMSLLSLLFSFSFCLLTWPIWFSDAASEMAPVGGVSLLYPNFLKFSMSIFVFVRCPEMNSSWLILCNLITFESFSDGKNDCVSS